MVSIPANVLNLINRPDSMKVMSTCSKDGMPHVIACGSVFTPDDSTLAVGEVIMKVTSANLMDNGMASFMVISGAEAYQIDAKARQRLTEGDLLDGLNVKLDRIHLKAVAVWLFDVTAVTVASANDEAGKRIA